MVDDLAELLATVAREGGGLEWEEDRDAVGMRGIGLRDGGLGVVCGAAVAVGGAGLSNCVCSRRNSNMRSIGHWLRSGPSQLRSEAIVASVLGLSFLSPAIEYITTKKAMRMVIMSA